MYIHYLILKGHSITTAFKFKILQRLRWLNRDLCSSDQLTAGSYSRCSFSHRTDTQKAQRCVCVFSHRSHLQKPCCDTHRNTEPLALESHRSQRFWATAAEQQPLVICPTFLPAPKQHQPDPLLPRAPVGMSNASQKQGGLKYVLRLLPLQFQWVH